jgi:hypothetical protein
MAAALSIIQGLVTKPSARIMRRENQTHDDVRDADGTADANGDRWVKVALAAGETSLDWTPTLIPAFLPHGGSYVRCSNDMAIVRPGYEEDRLGMASDIYRIVDRRETVAAVEQSAFGKVTREAGGIDGHGYHVIDSFRLDTLQPFTITGLPLVSRLILVHAHTGKDSVRASVVCYLGREVVIGSRNFTRKLHVGTGARDMGVGSRANWIGVIDSMLETAMLQQGVLAECLAKGASQGMNEPYGRDVEGNPLMPADAFERAGVPVERIKLTKEETERGVIAPIVPKTALDVVIAHHKSRRGRIAWGVWSRRLEGEALGALLTITGMHLPKKGGR